jgi:hypothetical protein
MQVESSDQRQKNDTANNPKNEESSRGQHCKTIESKRSYQTVLMNPDDGLLDVLIAIGTITHQQDEVVRSKPTPSARADQLLIVLAARWRHTANLKSPIDSPTMVCY